MKHFALSTPTVSCNHCRITIQKALAPLATNVRVDLVKKEPFGRLEPWLEVHLGVGTAACVGVFLHADFVLRHPVGWALLVLSVLVLAAGIVGAWFFRVLPPKLATVFKGQQQIGQLHQHRQVAGSTVTT